MGLPLDGRGWCRFAQRDCGEKHQKRVATDFGSILMSTNPPSAAIPRKFTPASLIGITEEDTFTVSLEESIRQVNSKLKIHLHDLLANVSTLGVVCVNNPITARLQQGPTYAISDSLHSERWNLLWKPTVLTLAVAVVWSLFECLLRCAHSFHLTHQILWLRYRKLRF